MEHYFKEFNTVGLRVYLQKFFDKINARVYSHYEGSGRYTIGIVKDNRAIEYKIDIEYLEGFDFPFKITILNGGIMYSKNGFDLLYVSDYIFNDYIEKVR